MENFVNDAGRFFDAGQKIGAVFDMNQAGEDWMTYEQIAVAIGVPVTVGSMVQIGTWLSANGVKRRRTSSARLVLMPKPRTA
jgi:hypothetical protein